MRKKHSKSAQQLITKNIHYILIGTALVMFWRGVWNLLDRYFIPENFLLSNLICLLIALLLFYLDDRELGELMK